MILAQERVGRIRLGGKIRSSAMCPSGKQITHGMWVIKYLEVFAFSPQVRLADEDIKRTSHWSWLEMTS